jgi:TetR/AcrR family transcriptional repressor of nem operon
LQASLGSTAEKRVDGAGHLMMLSGQNGFSYADLAQRYSIRKPSIHHHFILKADLVVAVIEQGRERIRAQIAALEETTPVAMDQLRTYTGYRERRINDQSAAFCLAGASAAELPSLPDHIASSVRGHAADLATWLELTGLWRRTWLHAPKSVSAQRAENFMAAVFGAMLVVQASTTQAASPPSPSRSSRIRI